MDNVTVGTTYTYDRTGVVLNRVALWEGERMVGFRLQVRPTGGFMRVRVDGTRPIYLATMHGPSLRGVSGWAVGTDVGVRLNATWVFCYVPYGTDGSGISVRYTP